MILYIDFDPSDENSSLGKYLKSIREEKEISIEELAETTKIKQEYLEAIEDDKYDVLPEGPYLKLFLKSYSEALDIEYDKLVSYLEAATAQAPTKPVKAKPSGKKPKKESKPASEEEKAQTLKPVVDIHDKSKKPQAEKQGEDTKKYLMIIGAVVFVAFIAVVLLIILTAKPAAEETAVEEPEVQTEVQPTEAELEQQRLEEFLADFDSLTVAIYPATQQAITVVVNDNPQTKLVYPERVWRVTAEDSLFISMERMDDSEIFINGFALVLDTLNLVGEHAVLFDKTNWVRYVDTTLIETQEE
ncbi:MAG: helix-turn-helix domain-containing protein [candidate division Zixibacteria bacterium]|nr:helix-turn-helix domain-containing protein [candidate division Zixibacteria bacterium]